MFGEVDYVNQVLSTLFEAIGRALPGIMAGLTIFVAFLIAASLVRRIFDRLARGVEEHRRPLVGLAAQTARYVIITAGLTTALGTTGIDVSALLPGPGLTGLPLGYPLRAPPEEGRGEERRSDRRGGIHESGARAIRALGRTPY